MDMGETIKPRNDNLLITPLSIKGIGKCPFSMPKEDFYFEELNRQVLARPIVWGVGLWGDEETEEVAKKIASLIYLHGCFEADSFVPSDSMGLIDFGGVGGSLFYYLFPIIEDEFKCRLYFEMMKLDSRLTFGEFVEKIMKVRGTCPNVAAIRTAEGYNPKGLWGFVYERFGQFSWLFLLLAVEIVLAVVLRICGLQYVRLITAFVSSVAFMFWGRYQEAMPDRICSLGFAALTICMANVIFWYAPIERIVEWIML